MAPDSPLRVESMARPESGAASRVKQGERAVVIHHAPSLRPIPHPDHRVCIIASDAWLMTRVLAWIHQRGLWYPWILE